MPVARKSRRVAAVPNPTTINVSPAFADALKESAKDEGESIAALCDRVYLKHAQGAAAKSLEKRLAKMRPQATTEAKGATSVAAQ
jgi:hypothetical protein